MYWRVKVIVLIVWIWVVQNPLLAQSRLPCRQPSIYPSNWKCLGPFIDSNHLGDQHAGMVSTVVVNPTDSNEMYIGGSLSGLFYTANRGKTWQCLTDSAPFPVVGIKGLLVDFKKTPHTLVMATGGGGDWFESVCFGILRSEDHGEHWQAVYKQHDNAFVTDAFKGLVTDTAQRTCYAFSNKKIIRSRNAGKDWENWVDINQLGYTEHEITSLAFDINEERLFATLYAYPIKKDSVFTRESQLVAFNNCKGSTEEMTCANYTAQLKEAFSNDAQSGVLTMKVYQAYQGLPLVYVHANYATSTKQVIYYFNTQYNQVAYYTLPNNGSLPEDITWFEGLKVNPRNPAVMYMAGTVLYKSIDSGKTFRPLYSYGFGDNHQPHADIRTYAINRWSEDGSTDEIYLGTDGGLSFTNNGGTSFRNLNGTQLVITQFYGLGISPFTSVLSAGAQDNSIFSYKPKTREWIYEVRGDGYDVEYSQRLPGVAYGQYNSRILRSTQNDVAPFDGFVRSESFEPALNRKTLQTTRNGNVYFAERKFHVYRYREKKWYDFSLPMDQSTLSFQVAPSDSSRVYLAGHWNGFYRSEDGGQTFQDLTEKVTVDGIYFGNQTRHHALCIHPDDADKVWISLGYLGNYEDWCKQTHRVLYSEDGGLTWSNYSEGLPIYNVADLQFLEGTEEALFAATLEGVYFRENRNSRWQLFSTNLPKCIIPEMKIDYLRGTLVAATFGRGLWETDLPAVTYTSPRVVNSLEEFKKEQEKEGLFLHRSVYINGKGVLKIYDPVVLGKHVTITYGGRRNKRLQLIGKGELIRYEGK